MLHRPGAARGARRAGRAGQPAQTPTQPAGTADPGHRPRPGGRQPGPAVAGAPLHDPGRSGGDRQDHGRAAGRRAVVAALPRRCVVHRPDGHRRPGATGRTPQAQPRAGRRPGGAGNPACLAGAGQLRAPARALPGRGGAGAGLGATAVDPGHQPRTATGCGGNRAWPGGPVGAAGFGVAQRGRGHEAFGGATVRQSCPGPPARLCLAGTGPGSGARNLPTARWLAIGHRTGGGADRRAGAGGAASATGQLLSTADPGPAHGRGAASDAQVRPGLELSTPEPAGADPVAAPGGVRHGLHRAGRHRRHQLCGAAARVRGRGHGAVGA
ncbi:hypothetical protein C4K16_3676 [Pseudomonas chlororaphis subsp. aurantiaca]|nr:hypothetical protein C4K16_3676 [Pseudomonas chlororaphis subsp. aurantiaca]